MPASPRTPLGIASAALLVGALAPVFLDDTPEPARPGPPVTLRLEIEDRAVATVDPRFLSVALDAASLVGGVFWDPAGEPAFGFGSHRRAPFDFSRPKLRALTAALGPAYLRVGGSEADRVYYDLSDSPGPAPEGYEEVLTAAQLDALGAFAKHSGLELVFTLNAGPAARDADGAWNPSQAELLIRHTEARGWPVAVWELGNEVNGYAALFGPLERVSGEQYAADLATARRLLDRVAPKAELSGPSSAYFPRIGEPLAVLPGALAAGAGESLDVLAWHYYPMQSTRCPVRSRAASVARNLDPPTLDEVARWASEVEAARDAHAAGAPIWLAETGNAQCGGAPDVSDRFVGSFWWLDQLGQLARRGVQVVVRQTLVGSDYGLLDEQTLEPRPDYWASLLFRKYMGPTVLSVAREDDAARVRTYAHCGVRGGVSLLVINLDPERAAIVPKEGLPAGRAALALLTADELTSRTARLNGEPLRYDGALPDLTGAPLDGDLVLPPASIGFLALPDAEHTSCLLQ